MVYMGTVLEGTLLLVFKKHNLFNMDNLVSYEILQALQIIGIFIGLYAILLGLLLEIDRPKLKKK